jgi:hypothetical protein
MIKKYELNNLEISLFALYKLGGITQKVHTEKIAFECFNLAQERFSWRLKEFNKFPDKSPVRFALEQAKKEEYGNLVIGKAGGDFAGSEREGWRFTPVGAKWIKENEERIAKVLKQERPEFPQREAERFIRHLKSDFAFTKFKKDGNLENISKYNFSDLLNCPPDADLEIKKQKFVTLQTTAELIKDNEIINFLKQCKEKFLK